MIKFIKKYKFNFIGYLFCAFAMALFTIISFSCKTYAYSINEQGNLVGDNLFNINEPSSSTNVTYTINDNYQNIVLGNNQTYGRINYSYVLDTYTTYTISFKYEQTITTGFFVVRVSNTDNNNPLNNTNGIQTTTFTTQSNGSVTFSFYTNTSQSVQNQLTLSYIMLNKGSIAKDWDPYGVWYSENNYNAVIEDNEDLLEQINFRDTSSLLSGIKTTLDNTNLKIYNANNLSLTQMLGTTPFHIETISFPNEDYNYNMEYCNIDTWNAIINNNGEFSNGDTLTNDPTLLYTFKTPLFVSALTFSRNDTSGTRYIDLYFTDNTSTQLLLSEGSENNRLDITWVNTDNKYIQYLSTTAEIGFNCVYAFTIPNSNQIYTSGYANGYTDGMYEQYQNDATSIQNANQAKQAMYSQGYSKGIEDASKSHDLGWSSLFFAMADTPFKVVSNVLGFELFGLNLFTTFIGMITVFGVVYLLKKFL